MGHLIKTVCRISFLLSLLIATGAGAEPDGMARQMLAETNLARTAPRRYAGHLQEMRSLYHGKAYRMPGSGAVLMTSEGVAALEEAISFLSKQKPLPPLAWSQGLAEAAADLVRDQGKAGEVGHDGNSGGMQKRIESHGKWGGRIAENIGYGPDTARFMVISLIIDDGVPDRGHRKNIFNPDFQVAGAACGPHPVYRIMCVMDFATRYTARKDK